MSNVSQKFSHVFQKISHVFWESSDILFDYFEEKFILKAENSCSADNLIMSSLYLLDVIHKGFIVWKT